MREEPAIIGSKPEAPAEDQPAPPSALAVELAQARKLLAQKMGEGFQMDPSPMLNPTLCFGLSHDGLVIDVLIDLIIARGVASKEDFELALLGKLREQILKIEQSNAALRHRIVVAQPGRG